MKKLLLLTLYCIIFTPLAYAENASNGTQHGRQHVMKAEYHNAHRGLLQQLHSTYPDHAAKAVILVSISEQMLYFYSDTLLERSYPVSTAANGAGNLSGSGKTPLGAHRISQRFGEGAAIGAIFKARINTGKIAKIITEPIDIAADAVTTRILWLDGLERGKNKGGKVDSHSRYIYIHGTPEEGLIGNPASHGCVRMLNKDVIDLFSISPVDALVYILE